MWEGDEVKAYLFLVIPRKHKCQRYCLCGGLPLPEVQSNPSISHQAPLVTVSTSNSAWQARFKSRKILSSPESIMAAKGKVNLLKQMVVGSSILFEGAGRGGRLGSRVAHQHSHTHWWAPSFCREGQVTRIVYSKYTHQPLSCVTVQWV